MSKKRFNKMMSEFKSLFRLYKDDEDMLEAYMQDSEKLVKTLVLLERVKV